MSTTTTSTAAAGAAVRTAVGRQTYWCHECDMSVSLHSSYTTTTTYPLRCPYCHSDFLEEMESSPVSNPNNNPSPLFPSFLDPTDDGDDDDVSTGFHVTRSDDDNFLLDSPYLHRLIHHLSNSNSNPAPPTTSRPHHSSPASKSAVEAIPTVKITTAILDLDPIILCAVCKDQFVIHDETKQLPCNHMYHPDCILPWLSNHNSCPVCRFQLPTDGGDLNRTARRRSRNRVLRLGGLMEGEDDGEELLGFSSALGHMGRRHRFSSFGRRESVAAELDLDPHVAVLFSRGRRERVEGELDPDLEGLFSPTQIGEAEVGLPVRANSVETVSSWPSWPAEGGAGSIGVGDGEIAVTADMVNEEGDIVM